MGNFKVICSILKYSCFTPKIEETNDMTEKESKINIKPGEIVPDSGIYKDTNTGEQATLVKGEPAPPTQNQESSWQQVIDTNTEN
jgi:hypothetical protein